jgi:hypothetical protein
MPAIFDGRCFRFAAAAIASAIFLRCRRLSILFRALADTASFHYALMPSAIFEILLSLMPLRYTLFIRALLILRWLSLIDEIRHFRLAAEALSLRCRFRCRHITPILSLLYATLLYYCRQSRRLRLLMPCRHDTIIFGHAFITPFSIYYYAITPFSFSADITLSV